MKANELRLGNWIKTALSKDRGKPYQVVALRDNEVSTDKAEFQFNPIWTDLHYIKPIKLSEEWLLKFGFVDMIKNEEDTYTLRFYYPFYNSDFSIVKTEFKDKRDSFYCLADNIKIHTELEYVHQLQNLYFALMGKELEIQELKKNENLD